MYLFTTNDQTSQFIEGCEFRFGAFATNDITIAEMLRKKSMVTEVIEKQVEDTSVEPEPKKSKGK